MGVGEGVFVGMGVSVAVLDGCVTDVPLWEAGVAAAPRSVGSTVGRTAGVEVALALGAGISVTTGTATGTGCVTSRFSAGC